MTTIRDHLFETQDESYARNSYRQKSNCKHYYTYEVTEFSEYMGQGDLRVIWGCHLEKMVWLRTRSGDMIEQCCPMYCANYAPQGGKEGERMSEENSKDTAKSCTNCRFGSPASGYKVLMNCSVEMETKVQPYVCPMWESALPVPQGGKEMREVNKPEILSDEQIQKMFDYAYYQDQAFSAGMSNEPCEPETLMKRVATVQRDAAVAYYEPLFKQARREVRECLTSRIAENIFAEAEELQKQGKLCICGDWLEFKAKYLGK